MLQGQWDKFQKQVISGLKDQLKIFTEELKKFEQVKMHIL